ncbi:NAD(P)/FAD-dependent oxidoreductase [Streptomyces daliensis]
MRLVVIGAGIVGAAVADRLAAGGGEVTVIDSGPPGAGTSRSSMAWVNAHNKQPRHYFELNRAGMRAHARLAEELGGDWYHPADTMQWAPDSDPAGMAHVEATVTRLREWGQSARWLTREEALEMEPALALPTEVRSVALFEDEALVDGEPLARLLVERARERGAVVRTGPEYEAVGIDTEGGRARGVRLAGGGRLPADVVVCCAGWRTPAVAALAGASAPLVPGEEPGTEAPTLLASIVPAPGAMPMDRMILGPDLHARPLPGGRVYLEGLDLEVDAHTSAEVIERYSQELLERARRTLPGVAEGAELEEGRVCVRPLPLDGYPLIGGHAHEGIEGFYTVVMHSGITLALHVADLVTRELLNGEDAEELAPYRPARCTA